MKKILFLVISVCMLFSAPAFCAKVRIAVVDMRRISREANIARKLTNDFFKDVQSKRQQLKAREEKLKKKEEAFKKKVKILSKKERKNELEKLKKEANEIKRIRIGMENELRTKREQISSTIMAQLKNVVYSYARKHNYTVIIPKRMLLYSQDAIDITDEIIKELNKKGMKKQIK